MSDGLSPQPPASPHHQPATASDTASVVRQAAAVVVGFAVVGVVCGVVWWWLWTPPTGTVADGHWYPGEPGLRGEFRGTGWYVVVAVVAGLLLGVLAAWCCDRSEVATLVAVVVGSVLAAVLMRVVGEALGPPDPIALARTTTRTSLPGDLRVGGWAVLATFPFASLLGLCGVYLLTVGRRGREVSPPDSRPG